MKHRNDLKLNIDKYQDNETKDNKDLNTSISENGTGKLRSSNKIRRFDTARRSYLSNFSDAKGISPFNRPKVELSSPNEVKLGSTSVQKYFTYLTMDLINKYFRPEKQNIDKPPSFDDLDEEDIDNGFDDYMNIDAYKWNGERPLMEVINNIRENDGYIDEVDGLEDTDGGMMLIKRADYNNSGDIRDYLENSLDFANYGADNVESLYKDLLFITAHS